VDREQWIVDKRGVLTGKRQGKSCFQVKNQRKIAVVILFLHCFWCIFALRAEKDGCGLCWCRFGECAEGLAGTG